MREFVFPGLALLLIIVLFIALLTTPPKSEPAVEKVTEGSIITVVGKPSIKIFRTVDSFHNVIYYTEGNNSQFAVVAGDSLAEKKR